MIKLAQILAILLHQFEFVTCLTFAMLRKRMYNLFKKNFNELTKTEKLFLLFKNLFINTESILQRINIFNILNDLIFNLYNYLLFKNETTTKILYF
jgi:hypothetical protein